MIETQSLAGKNPHERTKIKHGPDLEAKARSPEEQQIVPVEAPVMKLQR